jgi:hypothetical protein
MRKREFSAQMERVVPWVQLELLITPHAPEGRRGRPAVNLRMATEARNQCCTTLETLATIKNPPVVFAVLDALRCSARRFASGREARRTLA